MAWQGPIGDGTPVALAWLHGGQDLHGPGTVPQWTAWHGPTVDETLTAWPLGVSGLAVGVTHLPFQWWKAQVVGVSGGQRSQAWRGQWGPSWPVLGAGGTVVLGCSPQRELLHADGVSSQSGEPLLIDGIHWERQCSWGGSGLLSPGWHAWPSALLCPKVLQAGDLAPPPLGLNVAVPQASFPSLSERGKFLRGPS